MQPKNTQTKKQSVFKVHAALIAVQVIFGGGSIVGKLGVAEFNPLLFALIREGLAGPLLLVWALASEGARLPAKRDIPIFLACAVCVFSNQAFFIVGDKLAGAVIASAWQCSQPIMTLVISLCLRWESPTVLKIGGIAVAFAGGAFMVTYGQSLGSTGAIGNILLFLNCLGTALYVIFAKIALRKYPALTTTAWSYLGASIMMAITASICNTQCSFIHFVCPPTDSSTLTCGNYDVSCSPWDVPLNSIGPLAYWILFNSILAYYLMTWGNQYAKPGFVLAYTAFQPLTSSVLSVVIIAIVGASGTSLVMPGLNALGGIGVVAGVLLIFFDGIRTQKEDEKKAAQDTLVQEGAVVDSASGAQALLE